MPTTKGNAEHYGMRLPLPTPSYCGGLFHFLTLTPLPCGVILKSITSERCPVVVLLGLSGFVPRSRPTSVDLPRLSLTGPGHFYSCKIIKH